MKLLRLIAILLFSILLSCSDDDDDPATTSSNNTNNNSPCTSSFTVDQTRGACDQTLTFTPQYSSSINGGNLVITSNCIPNHMVGLFGAGQGSLNPNAISPQNETYTITTSPSMNSSLTPLLSTAGQGGNAGPQYSFGIMENGIELDPVAAEPFPHGNRTDPNVNWEWNLEALNVNLGLDCNNAHVQPNGKYHYHSFPADYIASLNIPSNQMTKIGTAADGFPIYYKYAPRSDADQTIIEMTSSYRLKSGDRPGDGITAPCGSYDGVYSNDYEYVNGLGTLDEANGRFGVIPNYPNGTYYYVITDEFPSIPRFFKGTPSNDFLL